jgi:hypothetical protein
MADKLKYAIGNSSSTTLSGSVANDDTTMTITSDTNFAAKEGEGMIIVDEGTATEEFAYSTGKTGTTLTTPLANRGLEGGEAKAHDANATVKGIITATMWNDVIDSLANVVDKTTGTVKPLTLPQINDTSSDHQYVVAVSELAADRTVTLPLLTGNDEFVFKDHAQTLTNKTLTLPVFTGGIIKFNAPEGFLINGKIVPSVADNDLTVAIKGLDGNDPSATNPVYCRIGDTVHAITAALSVTKADGTNWFNAGSAELATKEVDYFVYLGYNATDGVVIGFSRIPYATQYDQFSATTTNEKYCAISTISNAAAGDDYTVVGRFAATLSAGAGYTWSVPTFTTINLIQRPIFETRWLSWLPTWSLESGGTLNSTYSTRVGTYKVKQYETHIKFLMTLGTVTSSTPNKYFVVNSPIALTTGVSSDSLGFATYFDNGTAYVGCLPHCSPSGTVVFYAAAANYVGYDKTLANGDRITGQLFIDF